MSEKRKLKEDAEEEKHDGSVRKLARVCEAGSSSDASDVEPLKVSIREDFESVSEKFRQKWDSKEAWTQEGSVELFSSPFQICRLFGFLRDPQVIDTLVEEATDVEFDRRQMDLYEFYQSADLANAKTPALKGFYDALRTDVLPLMQKLTGIELSHISASVSMYNSSDYLLVHDDLMTDRRIAFVFYLSPWKETWTEDMGGALELFENTDREPFFPPTRKIPPVNNQLVFFRVCSESFHQVEEVTNFEFPRLTINGWFHGPVRDPTEPRIPTLSFQYETPKVWEGELEELINPIYLKSEYKEDIQKQIETNSEASLEEFLDEEFYDKILSQIQNIPSEQWTRQGPANLRNYEALVEPDSTLESIQKLRVLLGSEAFFHLLHEYTELDLAGANQDAPRCSIEIQRWTQGCYTVLGDPSTYQDSTLDLVFYINAYPQVGVVTYLSPEEEPDSKNEGSEEEDDIDPVLLTIHPKDNALNIVYRSEGTTKFTKYVSRKCLEPDKFTYIVSCRYKE